MTKHIHKPGRLLRAPYTVVYDRKRSRYDHIRTNTVVYRGKRRLYTASVYYDSKRRFFSPYIGVCLRVVYGIYYRACSTWAPIIAISQYVGKDCEMNSDERAFGPTIIYMIDFLRDKLYVFIYPNHDCQNHTKICALRKKS